MRRALRAAAAGVGLCLLLAGCVTPISRQPWLRARSAHFDVISSASESRTRELVQRLELFRSTVLELGGRDAGEEAVPMLGFLLGDRWTYRRFRPRREVDGFFVAAAWRSYLIVDATRGEQSLRTAQHEYVHRLLRDRPVNPPPWYEEGLAELLSTLRVEQGELVVEPLAPERAGRILHGTPLGLRQLLGAREPMRWPTGRLRMFYAQSHALTQLLHWGHLHGHADRRAALRAYLEQLDAGADPDRALEATLAADPLQLENELLAWIDAGPRSRIGRARELAPRPAAVEIAPLPAAEALYLTGELAFALGDEPLARRLLRRADARRPDDARTAAALAMLAARAGARDADARIAAAAASAGGDPLGELWLADARYHQALRTPAAGRERAVQGAREGWAGILRDDPRSVAALTALGESYLGSEEPDERRAGIAALERARALDPDDERVRVSLSRLYVRDGQPERAAELLRETLASAHHERLDVDALRDLLEASGLGESTTDATRLGDAQLRVHAPADDASVSSLVPLVEIRGHAGLGERVAQDLLIAIDESNTALHATGQDVDGDGRTGRSRREPQWSQPPSRWSSDPDDAIIRAELIAARGLLDRLATESTRAAVITFAGKARVRAPLGPVEAAHEALEAYRPYVDRTGTSLAAPLRAAVEALIEAGAARELRRRTVILFSDGQPTAPSVPSGRKEAREAADVLGEYGIRVLAFGLGKDATKHPETFEEIASRTGGRYIPLEQPGDIVEYVQRISLAGLEDVEIHNRTTGERGRAVRVFPDGSFDAYLGLAPGPNTVEIRATLEGGRILTRTRRIGYEVPVAPGPADLARAEELRAQLQRRTVETELLRRMQRERAGDEVERDVGVAIEAPD